MPAQAGVEGTDGRYLRRDGSVPLSASWDAGVFDIRSFNLLCDAGGVLCIGARNGTLRFVYSAAEIAELLGVSNNQATLYLKNLRVGDLAGVGNRNVIADVNGDLSAP